MSKIRHILKRLTKPFLNAGLQFYYRKPRRYSYQDIDVIVHPEVFPPHLTLSTKILLDFISEIELQNKTFLELGCGSGIISLLASKKGAIVTASDINKTALAYLEKALEKNQLNVSCIYSNLFENLQEKQFDFIIINPPYYPKQPKSIKEQAWFCGEDFQYFNDLFQQLPKFLSKENNTYMILSEDCQIEKIIAIASENNLTFDQVFKTKKVGEINIIYSIKQSDT